MKHDAALNEITKQSMCLLPKAHVNYTNCNLRIMEGGVG